MFDPKQILARFDQLGEITDEPGHLCRTFLSPAMERANLLVAEWLREVGCETTVDGWGNLIGHLAGTEPEAKTLLLGSHLDTVRNAGKYDGPLGIIVAIEALASLQRRGVHLPFHVDILAFSDEEGTRFQSAYLGSKALAGLIDQEDLSALDDLKIEVRQAVQAFQGAKALTPPQPRYHPSHLLGYVEVHIEQGPVLEALGKPLGVVDHIAAQRRYLFTLEGSAGHAGTTPMTMRRDALACAAEFILLLEKLALETPGLVATVGKLEVTPNVGNVIPDRVRLTVDMRHAHNEVLRHTSEKMTVAAQALSQRRAVQISGTLVQGTPSVSCSPRLVQRLAAAIDPLEKNVPRLVSGAGHDGVILSQLTEIGMIFVRCKDGLSHNPKESVTPEDVVAACEALARFLSSAS